MGILRMILSHPDELFPLLKLKVAMTKAQKRIPLDPHLAFCYTTLNKVSKTFAFIIQQLGTELRNTMCVFYLILRALDTIEDDENIPIEIRVPTLIAFHRHIFDPNWSFPCGTNEHKVLMDQFHHVLAAFLELDKRYQDAIEDITKRIGAGMAKFICKEVETLDDYDEYCHYAAGLVGIGLSKLFLASELETLSPDWEEISNSTGLFLEKAHIIKDYHEDINAIPKERMYWPRVIWGKYVDKLEDFKYKENSIKALQCLSDMVTDALIHVEDSLKYIATLRDPAIFQLCGIPLIVDFGTVALCYNNIQVFRGDMRMRRGLVAKLIERTRTMDDAYGVFYDFSCIMKTKVNTNDPNASKILNRLEGIQKVCRNNGVLHKRKSYVKDEAQSILFVSYMVKTVTLVLLLAIVYAYRKANNVIEY